MARYTQAFIDLSSSMMVYTDKRRYTHHHFKWESIKKFLYLGFAFSSSSTNFDIFSNVFENVRFFDLLLCEVTVGMSYMFMDFFIKQYSRTIDFNKSLNPLLKGVTMGILLQTALWAILHASDLADSIRYLFVLLASLKTDPTWARCKNVHLNDSCVSPKDMLVLCNNNNTTSFNLTSAHLYYMSSFTHLDKNVLTIRFFASALVWIFNFFCTTVTTDTLIKFFKLSFLWRLVSTFVIVCATILTKRNDAVTAFAQILNVNAPPSYAKAMDHVSYIYGIGFIGVYDFGTMSPYTMVDNAVVIFTVIFTLSAIARSLVLKIMYLVLTSCIKVEISITPHYLLFAILPMSSELFYGHKLYIIYTYMNLLLATNAYLAMITLTMSKLVHSEFQSVNNLYIVGIICVLGFSLSVPITIQSMFSNSRHQGLIYGLKVTVLYLGGFKVAIVMWVYGIQRFSTDIHFWLGFKPTKFWTICWMVLPVVLFSFFVNGIYKLIYMRDLAMALTAALWIGFSILAVALFHVRTVASYLLRNNLAKVFLSSPRYGPPDQDERRRRHVYSETIQLRRCVHKCNLLDDAFDCNHLPLRHKSKTQLSSSSSSRESLSNLYTSDNSKVHRSIIVDALQ